MKYDTSVQYQKSHEWAKKEGDLIVVGISDYAQDSLGDVVFVELPEVGAEFSQGDAFGVVESVKAASDVFVPVGGRSQRSIRNWKTTRKSSMRIPSVKDGSSRSRRLTKANWKA
jgi:predicted transcriptional regulator